MKSFRLFSALLPLIAWPLTALADSPRVLEVSATANGNNWSFAVTLTHADEGWDHYANKWDIVGPDGTVLGTRVLYHPHVDEQPFTRGLPEVEIPAEINKVTIRAHDSVHGYGGREVSVEIPR